MVQLLTQILVLIQQIVAGQLTVLQALTKLEQSFVDVAVEHNQFNIEFQATQAATHSGNNYALLTDPTDGLVAIKNAILALGSPQSSTSPVILPTTPPTGYGGATASAAASAVWGANFFGSDTPESILEGLRRYMDVHSGTVGDAVGNSPWVRMTWNYNPYATFPYSGAPPVNPADIISTDANIGAWLNRVYSTWTWQQDPVTAVWYTFENHTNGAFYYVPISDEEFLWLRAASTGTLPGAANLAPVWPGLAHVTLGTPVAFSGSGFTVPGPMDGVRVSLTAVPTPLPYYVYGSMTAYGKLGALTFLSDDGDAETQEFLGFTKQVYVPKTMVQAASCEVWCKSGITGTVTPWTAS